MFPRSVPNKREIALFRFNFDHHKTFNPIKFNAKSH